MRILQISCSYFPQTVGGTEVYVQGLSKELLARGHQVFISYVTDFIEALGPKIKTREYLFEAVPIFVIEENAYGRKTRDLYYWQENPEFSRVFAEYIRRINPDIVHFHHYSPAAVILQMRMLKQRNIPIVMTYHTPMMTCGRGDMLYLGRSACTGRLDYGRCLFCAQRGSGIPPFLAALWSGLPEGLSRSISGFICKAGFASRFTTWLEFPWMTRKRIEAWKSGFPLVDHFVAVSEWVEGVFVSNDVPKERITLSRQGLSELPQALRKKERTDKLRMGYLGRVHYVKGLDILLKAMRILADCPDIELYIYGIADDRKSLIYQRKLVNDSRHDPRIKWMGLLKEEDKFRALSELDVLVIPSRWLESGPLALLEAWATATPAIASDEGSLGELIKDGQGGILFDSGNPVVLAEKIAQVRNQPGLLEALAAAIPPVRTMRQVCDDMEVIYKKYHSS